MKNIGNLMILGDSYSTFRGYNPEGYEYWYYEDVPPRTDVRDVKDTWWHQFVAETGANLVLTSAYSGTTIGHTGWHGHDFKKISFCGRFDKRVSDGFFDKHQIDTLILFGGTNDSWAECPLGEPVFDSWTEKDLYTVLPAISYLIYRAKTVLPEARIIFVINTELKPEITDMIINSCRHFGAEYVKLEDISKQEGHPNILGMKQIKDQIIAHLEKN